MLREASLIVIAAIVMVSALVGLLSSKYMGEDNDLEEAAEAVIKEEVGVSVDLSPHSPEPK